MSDVRCRMSDVRCQMSPNPARNSKVETRNSKPRTRNLKPETLNLDRRDLFSLRVIVGELRCSFLFCPTFGDFQCLEDRRSQLCGVETALDLSALHKRNQSRLFRNNNGHC